MSTCEKKKKRILKKKKSINEKIVATTKAYTLKYCSSVNKPCNNYIM